MRPHRPTNKPNPDDGSPRGHRNSENIARIKQRETMVVNKITWAKVGGLTEPGRYMFRFGWLTITAEDLAIWQQLPNAEFTLVQTIPATAELGSEFRLGTFGAPQ